jgi:peptidoglycan biosynthesis protein MviN/MurJ (putative lipid II flippase)
MAGYAVELAALLGLAVLGMGTFAVFEVETPAWRKILKWALVSALTLVAARYIGHAALWILAGLAVAGLGFHVYWCRKHGIHPVRATPRRRYYELRGWPWPD